MTLNSITQPGWLALSSPAGTSWQEDERWRQMWMRRVRFSSRVNITKASGWVFLCFLPQCWRLFVVVVVAIGGSAMAMARLALTPALPLVAGGFSDVSTHASGRTNVAGLGSAARRPLSISYQTRRLSTRALSAPKGKLALTI